MVKLVLADQYANLFLLINGLAILLYIAAIKKSKQRAIKFGNYETLQKIAGRNFLKSSNYVLLIRLFALTSLLVGLSSPVLVSQKPIPESDYVLALDSSASMLSSDIEPTRFQAAKDISSSFVNELPRESSIGVVSFAGEVQNELELSGDRREVRSTIQSLETGDQAGTAIGDALSASAAMLTASNRSRTVILVTDGRNNVGSSINESVEFAVRHNVTVNAIGIGSEGNQSSRFAIVDGQNATRAVFPNLDEEQLSEVANKTGGRFMTVENRTAFRTAFISLEQSRQERDISRYFILAAAAFLLIEWLLGSTRLKALP